MRFNATPWARKRMSDEDRAEIDGLDIPGVSAYITGLKPHRPAMGGWPEVPGWYRCTLIAYPWSVSGEASSPIGAFRAALQQAKERPQ